MKIAYQELDFIHSTLQLIMADYEGFFGTEQLITSLYRIGDTGVHGQLPVRGVDMRCREDVIGYHVEEYINSRWVYDDDRPSLQVCIYHDTGRGKHIHLQVSNKTQRSN